MPTPDPSSPRRATRSDRGRIRPAGWSPGTGTLIGAWIASAAIARLTGATAVILLLAAAVVAMLFEIVAGRWTIRSVHVRSLVAAPVVTAGEHCRLLVMLDAAGRTRPVESRRVTITQRDGTVVSIDGAAASRSNADSGTGTSHVAVCFPTPGVVTELIVSVDVAGPAGLVWWRRTASVDVDELHVAPVGHGPLLDTESVTSTSDGSVEAQRGNHDGEIDGVRPWRPGDSTNSVHWASSLRTNELIVHDRLTAADQRWVVDFEDARDDAGRLRWTLDEGRRHGHAVSIRTADGVVHAVPDEDAAARWSAIAAQGQADNRAAAATRDGIGSARTGLLHREIRLRPATIETETSITNVARWTAAAAAFASMGMLVGALHGSATTLVLVLVAVVVGALVSMWVARRSGRRPPAMQAAIVAVVLLALAVIAMQATDVDGLLAALRGPLPNVLMLLVVLHGFEAIDRRTLRVHLAITFVLASYAAGLRIDAMLGWWLAAWGIPFAVSMLMTARRSRPRPDRASVQHRPLIGSARGTVHWIGSVVALGAATLALLSLVPIPDGPARLGLPALSADAPSVASPGALGLPDGSTASGNDPAPPDRGSIGNVVGYPGFTETLDTSVRGDLGDQIVMRVRAPEPAFWRGQTFTEFDGRTWTVSPDLGRPRDGPVIDLQPTVGDAFSTSVPSRELVQTYFVEQDLPNLVFAAARPVQVIFDGTLWTRPDGALRSDVTLTAGSVYTVISERPQVDADILRAQGDLGQFFAGFRDMAGGEEIEPFLEVPGSTTQRTIDLATSLRTPGESTYDTILAYEAWLGANTEYDLDAPIPADGADAVDDFLFESQLGFCEQIASTLTIMLRSQGVPARLATGYVPGERDRVSGVWNVRGSDAHAWVEVWFPQTGWQAFDPTAEVPLAADAGDGTVGGDLIGATVSSIASYRLEIGATLLAAAVAWGLLRLLDLAGHRRRRGRWGLLQDRFAVLTGPGPTGAEPVRTNAQIATSVTGPEHEVTAQVVADQLDRVAFDPSWVDDDEQFERARSALATLERSSR